MATGRVKFHKSTDSWKHEVHVTLDVFHYGALDKPYSEEQVLLQYKDAYIELTKAEALELSSALTRAVDAMDEAVEVSKKKFVKELTEYNAKKEATK